jgi:hypothetical protein
MIYYMIHKDEFMSEMQSGINQVAVQYGDYFILRFKSVNDLPLLIDNKYKRLVNSEVLSNKILIDNGEQLSVKKDQSLDVKGIKQDDLLGIQKVAVLKPSGESYTLATHDLCDPCSWERGSTEVTGEALSSNNDLTFTSVNSHWIDLTHGRYYKEDDLSNKKEPKVYIDGVIQTDGYSVNYDSGSITFDNPVLGFVTCDYYHSNTSEWVLEPSQGKKLNLEHAEIQFGKDINMNAPLSFKVMAYNPYFNPAEPPSDENPLRVQYSEIKYKSIKDVIIGANLGQGYIPKVSGLQNDVVVFPFNYSTIIPIQSSLGMQIVVSIEGHQPYAGEFAVCTFYLLEENET